MGIGLDLFGVKYLALSKPFFKGICELLERAMYGIEQTELIGATTSGLRSSKALLKLLLHKGLVKIDVTQGEPIYRITRKGAEFLRTYTEFELYGRRYGALKVNL